MGLVSTIKNAGEGIVNFFTGGYSKGSMYPWYSYFQDFLQESSEVLSNQPNWRLNLGYSFVVVSDDKPHKFYEVGDGDGEHKSFSEFKLNINPNNLTVHEPFAINIIPTQTGVVSQHSGSIFKEITLSGTTGVHPRRGAGGVQKGTLGNYLSHNGVRKGPNGNLRIWNTEKEYANPPKGQGTAPALDGNYNGPGGQLGEVAAPLWGGVGALNGEPPGFYHFHMLKNYLRAYAQLKADPRHKKAVLVFKNRKDGEDWIVEPTGFTMVRSASNPFLYTYNITLRALKRTFALPGLDDSDSLGAFGQFLGQLENAETVLTGSIDLINTGAGIITQALDYVVQIEQSFETLIMSPIHAVTNVLQAVQNGVNRVSALPRKFYTDLQANITVLERSLEDRTNLGSSTYNARMGRISTANPAADREATPEELLIFKGLNYVQRGLTIATATNLIFSTETSDPTVSSVDAFNTSNSIILSSNDKIKLKKTTLEGIQRLFNNELILTIPNSAIVTTIRYGETLEEIAMRTLGDVSRWYDIVAINQLKHPYIEETADFGAKTLGYGDKIYIPSSSPITKYNIIKGRETYITENMSEVEKSMGVDLEINLDGDLRINARQDIDLVAGAANAAQAIHLALSIEQGALKYHLYKGVSLQPGFKDSSKIDEIMDNIKSSILSDPRFERITDMSLVRDGPMILIDMRVQVTNIGRTIPLQISL